MKPGKQRGIHQVYKPFSDSNLSYICGHMRPLLTRFLILILFSSGFGYAGNNAREYLNKGWQELVKDNDALALQNFAIAYEIAYKDHDILTTADALLNMGICSYGSSSSNGLSYAMQALEEYSKAEKENPGAATEGRYRCLQLISTIYSRQGKYWQAIFISHKVLKGIDPAKDTIGTYGLALSSIGSNYYVVGIKDSSEWYHKKALEQYIATGNSTYIPGGYVKLGNIYLEKKEKDLSRRYFEKAYYIADSTGNRQAMVMSLNSLGDWEILFGNRTNAETCYLKSTNVGMELTDKLFLLSSLKKLTNLYKNSNDDHKALFYSEQIQHIKDSIAGFEREQLVRNLEMQMEVSEKTRQLELVEKEKKYTELKNYFLYVILAITLIASCFMVYYQKRVHNRDKEILKKKEEVQQAIIEQQRLKDIQLSNEIDYKESQLSALTLQMLQKNELLQELKEKLDNGSKDQEISKVVNKGFNQDKDWEDFNLHFESINRNFYAKVREAFPGISPNELKICALIKLNLSIKEMASILNISPDSVKTARYRLRKKLQLNTEDNLTEFIQGIS